MCTGAGQDAVHGAAAVRLASGRGHGVSGGALVALVGGVLLAGWLSLAQADVYVRQNGETLTLTNVPDTEDYTVMLVEPVDVVLAAGIRDSLVNGGAAAAAPGAAPPSNLAGRAGAPGPGVGGGEAPFMGHLKSAALRHGVPEALLRAVIRVESNFNPRAVSPRGARGLMQLMPATARGLGLTDAFDPAANIDAGARYLRQLLDEFGHDLRLTLAAYNAGPNAVKRWGGVPRYAETEQYVPRVLGHFEALGGRLPAQLPARSASRWR